MIDAKLTKDSRDTAAGCHMRAAEDRVRADGMDTTNGRRKFEESAASWDARGELLGRLEISFAKRERLDAASKSFRAARQAEWLAGDAGLVPLEGDDGEVAAPPSDSPLAGVGVSEDDRATVANVR